MATRATRYFHILMAFVLVALTLLFGYTGIDRLNMFATAIAITVVALASGVKPEIKLPNGMTVKTKTANVLFGFWLVVSPFLAELLPEAHYSTAALTSGIFVAVMVITTAAVPEEVFDRDLPHVDHTKELEETREATKAAA